MKKILLLLALTFSIILAGDITPASELVKEANKKIKSVKSQELYNSFNKHILIIDVREDHETKLGTIDHLSTLKIPRGLLEFKVSKHNLQKYDKVFIYCAVGGRGALATLKLQEMGYTNVYNLSGGFKAWKKQCGPVRVVEDINFLIPNLNTVKPTNGCIAK